MAEVVSRVGRDFSLQRRSHRKGADGTDNSFGSDRGGNGLTLSLACLLLFRTTMVGNSRGPRDRAARSRNQTVLSQYARGNMSFFVECKSLRIIYTFQLTQSLNARAKLLEIRQIALYPVQIYSIFTVFWSFHEVDFLIFTYVSRNIIRYDVIDITRLRIGWSLTPTRDLSTLSFISSQIGMRYDDLIGCWHEMNLETRSPVFATRNFP